LCHASNLKKLCCDINTVTAIKHEENQSRIKMKAIVCERFGPVDGLKISDIPTPSIKNHDILIRTHAASVTTADWRIRTMTMPFGFGLLGRLVFGITKPRFPVLGTDLSGEIVATGKDVQNFKVGDEVVCTSGMGFGCHAEFKSMPQTGMIVPKPKNLSHEHAASVVFGGTAALDFLKNKAKIKNGDHILILGASGSVGTAAIQIAKHLGAKVTAVASGRNQNFVLSLGADEFIDYTKDDFKSHGRRYDVVLDCIETHTLRTNAALLKPHGTLLLVSANLPTIIFAPLLSLTLKIKILAGPQSETIENLNDVVSMTENGTIKPVIHRVFTVDEAIDAHTLVETRHKTGNVVIKF
jgi:NADPH:quinone reductase-like Zn-dependent oxidoreductase